jgi:hypothetical protein
MRTFIFVFSLLIFELAVGYVYAQKTFNEVELAKLSDFLSQESAEKGVRNYQQIGLASMTDIDWQNVPGLSWNRDTYFLESVSWSNKKLSGHLDFSDFAGLANLYCAFNELKSVNVKNTPRLLRLDLYTNELSAIDVTTNPLLLYLRLGYNQIGVVDLSNNPELTFFCCTNNQVEYLEVTNKNRLQEFMCGKNNLHTLIVEDCLRLEKINCVFNQLRSVSLKNLPSLLSFSCKSNLLTELQFENCESMETLICDDNYITSLDLSSLKKIVSVDCSYNQLTDLLLNGCEQLTTLHCHQNQLESLDVSTSPLLSTLHCYGNKLTLRTLPLPTELLKDYRYFQQQDIETGSKFDYIDLSTLNQVNDVNTRYRWSHTHNAVPVYPLEDNGGGVFAFDESYIGKTLICRVMNDVFPLLVLRFFVTFTNEDVSNNINSEMARASVYAGDGSICVSARSSAEVKIYSMDGMLRLQTTVGEGRTHLPIARGAYVVVLDDKNSFKVIVR